MFNETVGDHVIPILYTLRDGYDLQYFGARNTTKSSITGKKLHTGPDESIIREYLIKVNKPAGFQWRTASGTWFGEIPVCCCLTGSAWLCLDVSPNHVPEAMRHWFCPSKQQFRIFRRGNLRSLPHHVRGRTTFHETHFHFGHGKRGDSRLDDMWGSARMHFLNERSFKRERPMSGTH